MVEKTPTAAKQKSCFVICPIGEEHTPERLRSNQILRHMIAPVISELGYANPIRADEIGRPGHITNQIIEHLLADDLVIADLTGRNANVFYELAIRHAVRKPLVQLIQLDEYLPFDLAETRTIRLDHRDLDSVAACKDQLRKQIVSVEADPSLVDTPLSIAIDLQSARHSENPTEKLVIRLMQQIAELGSDLREMRYHQRHVIEESLMRREREKRDDVEARFLRQLRRAERAATSKTEAEAEAEAAQTEAEVEAALSDSDKESARKT